MIRIFIGSEPKTWIPKRVLQYSIEKHTSVPVEFLDLDSDESWTTRQEASLSSLGTGFSLLRWEIPQRCNHEGYAIYLDADIICLDDIKKLWEADVSYPNNDCSVWCTYQVSKWFKHPTPETSVMLINCFKAQFNQPSPKNIFTYLQNDPSREKYVKIMRALKHQNAPQRIPNEFNRLNALVETERNVLLHYTKEPEQPWYKPEHPFRQLWENYFLEALEKGLLEREKVREEIAKFQPHTKTTRGCGLNPFYSKFV